ncbi:MAG TPA: hypothetical protein VHQ41_01660 [Patescibacteria group bacterium]|jgi:hypothetical protein|nr:hypothetical protein [Patescibacteria group bacterium]
MNKFFVPVFAALIVVVVAGGVWYTKHHNVPLFSIQSFGNEQLLSGKYDVKSVAEESFGNLDKVSIAPAADSAKLSTGGAPVSGMGGSAGLNAAAPASAPSTSTKMIAPGEPYPGPIYYSFKYEGDKTLPGVEATQPVLKRSKPEQPASLVDRIVGMLSFGLINLNALKDVQLQNFSFVENHQYGYAAYVDAQNGAVSMYQNYEQWPQPDYTCKDTNCDMLQLKIEDLPSDADAIAAAETFIQQYAISKEGYGTPRVVSAWRIAYDQTPVAQRSSFYIPQQVQVVYPLMLEGKEVYDESGNVYGMNIMIDAKTKRVTNLSELITKQFESSSYKGETDVNRLLKIAGNGGFRNYNYVDSNAKKVELKLDTPTVQMVKIYYSADNYRTNSDLYMPALIFPIKNWKETNYWRQTVIVPLVKSILDSDTQNQNPIPLGAPATGGSGGGSAPGAAEPGV